MKISLFVSLAVITFAASSMQTASAQEARGARFNFAPNVYRTEQSRLPKGYGAEPMHNVRAGAVPSSNLLGVDPSMLAKPAPPPPVIAAHPAMTSVTPAMFIPKTNAGFNPMFGKPQVAQLPAPVPQQAVAIPMQMKPATAAPAQAAPRRHVNTGVAGRLLTPPRRRNIAPTTASPAVASYGKNFGYVPGAYLPSSGGSGGATTDVTGRLLTKTKHR